MFCRSAYSTLDTQNIDSLHFNITSYHLQFRALKRYQFA